jgi:hypothetical protein
MAAMCEATAASGVPCSAPARPGRRWCIWHDPEAAAERREMSRKGGAARSNKSRARKQYVDGILSPAELEGLIGATLKGVLVGKITPGQAQAVASLARAAVAVREAGSFEDQLADQRRELAMLRSELPGQAS